MLVFWCVVFLRISWFLLWPLPQTSEPLCCISFLVEYVQAGQPRNASESKCIFFVSLSYMGREGGGLSIHQFPLVSLRRQAGTPIGRELWDTPAWSLSWVTGGRGSLGGVAAGTPCSD